MTTQLSFIASNLDHYHFNTDEARALKREIQHWTTLPMNEQNAYAAEHRLLSRFQRMFVNNPYLEQKGLAWNADITGAAADAYFTEKNGCVSLLPEGAQPEYARGNWLTDQAAGALANEQLQRVKAEGDRKATYGRIWDACYTAREDVSQRFDHVLRDTSKVGKTTRNSPGLISAAICVAFYVLAVRFLGQTLWAVLQWHINLMDTPIYMAVVIAVALTAVVGFKWYCNTVIKGIYRSYMLRRLKKSQSSQNKKIQNALNGLQPDAWFDQYTGMISRDRAQMARNPETPLLQLETGRLLANVPKKTIFSIVGADLKPWSAYSPQGENRGVWLPLLMIALMVWQNFFG